MSHCNTFREELAIRYPMLGHALWEPDPGGLYDAVEVGDVGVIRGGRFHRLFNALRGHQPSDPDHRDGLRYPRQLQPRTPNHIIRSRDYQKDFPSKNVTKVDRGLNIHALGPDDGTQITISCSGRLGASISLPFPADSEDTIAHGDFSRWIIKNIDDCMRLADDLGWGVNRMEDIILVTGCHLAKSWANAAFSETRGGAEVSFSIRVSGHSGVHLEERNMSEGVLKLGPSGESLPKNQCIFIRGYRVARILNIWPRLRGAAGPAPDIHEPEPDSRLELISIPADFNYRDPLHTLLEYVAERAPDCDFALIHDYDLDVLEDDMLKSLRPDALKNHLRRCEGIIHQVQCELEPGSKGKSGTFATVATLSEDLFDVLNEDWGISSSLASVQPSGSPPLSGKTRAIVLSPDNDLSSLAMNVSPPVYTAVDPNTREIPSFNSSQPLSQPGPTASVSSPQSITHSRGSQMNDDVGTIPSGPSGSRHGETGGTPHSRPNDILVDGFLAHTFSSHDAHNFLSLLLRTPNFLQHYDLSYSQGAWYFMPKAPYVQPPSRGIPIQNSPLLIDFSVATTRGTVVPQRRWTPTDEVDVRRHVESAALQLPIFFINRRGGVGFRLLDILQGRDRDLDHGDREAPLGGRTTTHIRINWPSYGDWKRQIPAKDETYSRNPITLARFMRHVGTSVDKFFNQCMASDHVADPRWRIGMQGITQSDVKIIGAVHVSSGTWMPIIQLARYVL